MTEQEIIKDIRENKIGKYKTYLPFIRSKTG